MILETNRLILRPWEQSDAAELYKYACDPAVGPIAGWSVHTSVEYSRNIIKDVLSRPDTFAVILKETSLPVGSIGLMDKPAADAPLSDSQRELGYWIGVPYWGQGLIPEAAREIIRYGFEQLRLTAIWCGYYDGNEKSRRVQEKCGFKYHHTNENIYCELMDDYRTEHYTFLSKSDWLTMQKEAQNDH